VSPRAWLPFLALLGALVLTALLPARTPPPPVRSSLRVGLVFDVGGRGDKSFNDAAYAGLLEAARLDGVSFELAEPSGAEDREGAMRLFAARRFDLILGIGYIFTRDITEVARAFPGSKFACVDYAGEGETPGHLVGLRFREDEGAFLVGAAAGAESESKHVGFVGGMNIELIRRFEAGYRAGVREVCPGCEVHVAYAGTTPEAFRDPLRGKAITASQIASGVDVIFHASGLTGSGVFEAARAAGKRAIGVDRDQYDEAPGVVMTSMVKRVDTVVREVIREVAAGTFRSGVRSFGVREGGVDWVHEGPHAAGLRPATVEAVERLRGRVASGELRVSSAP
jgi:basic membrane protein A